MNEILIKRVNETNITIVQDGSDIFVPVHTITDALGVDFSSQRKRIMEDPILASTMVQKTTVGSDGKQRDCHRSQKIALFLKKSRKNFGHV